MIWSDEPAFVKLTSFVSNIAEGYPDNFTIFRAGDFLDPRYRGIDQRLAAYRGFKQLHHIDVLKVLEKTPQPFRLLYWALRRAKAAKTLDGFNTWGIAWTRKGLVFHYGRALDRIRKDLLLADRFGGDLYNDYLGPWSQEFVLNLKGPLKIPALARFTSRLSATEYEDAIEPYRLTKNPYMWSDLVNTDPRYLAENHLFFPFRGGKRYDIREYIAELVHLSTDEEAYAAALRDRHRFRERHDAKQEPTSKRTGKRERVVSVFSVDERQLGYSLPSQDAEDPEAIEGLVIRALKYCGETYISFPDIFALHHPKINESKWFDRRYIHATKKWLGPGNKLIPLNIDHVTLDNKVGATLRYKDTLYFHPGLMLPDGEAMEFLRQVIAIHPVNGLRLEQMHTAFYNFLLWVHDPKLLLHGQGQFGAELESLIDPSYNCPVVLSTPQERLDFFFQKGLKSRLRGLAYAPSPGKHGSRSSRMSIYDRWCVWYCSMAELRVLRYHLNNKQQCEFIAKRWLHWRRPASLKKHLWAGTYLGLPARHPSYPRDKTIDELIEQANDMFGPSFTSY